MGFEPLLEHVFMGDVTRFAEERYNSDPNSECLSRLLRFLDEAFATEDEKLRNLISGRF